MRETGARNRCVRRVRARRELEWLQLEGVAAQVSKKAGGERVEEGGRCVRREREPKCEAGGVRGGRGVEPVPGVEESV